MARVEGYHVRVSDSFRLRTLVAKQVMNRNLLVASEALDWPRKVVYESVPLEARRSFERAFQDLLYLQLECVAFL